MSEPGEEPSDESARPAPASSVYDTAEIRRCIVVSFSTPELRSLADGLGVGATIGWDRGASEAARDLVRQFERYYGLATLLARLKELRPLVEWPEPRAEGSHVAVPTTATSAAAPSAPSAPVLTIPDPHAAPPPSGAWPGTVAATAPHRSLDPRLLPLLGGALALLAALVAFAAGRASSGTAAPASSAPSPAAGTSTLANGPAARAAGALARSLSRVARECELPTDTRGALVLAHALAQCGPAPAPPRSTFPAAPTSDPPDRDHADTPAPARRSPAPKGGQAIGGANGPASGGCMSGCDASHLACKDTCGSEPTQSSQYDNYQHCRSRCLEAHSRCRLACQ